MQQGPPRALRHGDPPCGRWSSSHGSPEAAFSQLCGMWAAFSQPHVALDIQTKCPVVESVNLLVLVDEDSLFNSCDDYLLRPKYVKNMKQS